ncbi:MAG: putative nucleotidyltransferase substrate binding domain-containing protein [Desulfuromonadaceae bacterium]|nr:putative nucleotidyltransferase substrate binding domain-containing protein [Desulfuromonadaceae bacterium]
MDFLLSGKKGAVTSWRATEAFAADYRQALLDQAASDRSGGAEAAFARSLEMLGKSADTHVALAKELSNLLEQFADSPPAEHLKELTVHYYDVLYRHMGAFHSAPAFYQKSMEFMRMLSIAIMAHSTEQLGEPGRHLPEMALVAVGPAGRCEYSPFCQLQLLLVHEEATASQRQTINRLCHNLHAGFEAAGLAVDPVATPRNPEWRGSIAEWRQRCDDGLRNPTPDGLINILRLADQFPLNCGREIAQGLKEMTASALSENRPAQANLIERMESLSNGLGMMGRLKLERSGVSRGLFRLLDHGLLPLSAALSALALIKKSRAVSSPDRILALLERREMDVDVAEKMLRTWHTLHELRLRSEQAFSIVDHTEHTLLLNPAQLSVEERHSLKAALASVADIQRHVGIIFARMEG